MFIEHLLVVEEACRMIVQVEEQWQLNEENGDFEHKMIVIINFHNF